MQSSNIKDFTRGNITRQLIVFSLPLFLSNLLQILYNTVDMAVVGNVCGTVGISAVSVGGDVSAFLTFVAMGFSNAGQVIIAQYIGAGKRDRLGKFVGTMSSFLLLCSLVISALALIFQNSLLALMNTPKDAFSGAAEYSAVCMVGLVFIYGYNVVSAIMRGMGDSKHPFIFISIAAVLNTVLDLIFVAGCGMGPFGAGLATVISQGVSFILCVFFLYRNRQKFGLDLAFRDFLLWNREMLADLVKLGTPMAIKTASIQISKLFVNSWINSYSLEVSAFSGIANKLSSISNLVSAAMNTAGSTMVGQNIAAREFGRVKRILANLAVITLTVASAISVLICIFPTQIFGLFTTEADSGILEFSHGYVPIAILLFFGSAMRAIMNALLNGSGNYKINFATAILDGIVMRVGLALLFGVALDMKHFGFWLGDAIAGFTPFFIGLVFYFTGSWKKPKNKGT